MTNLNFKKIDFFNQVEGLYQDLSHLSGVLPYSPSMWPPLASMTLQAAAEPAGSLDEVLAIHLVLGLDDGPLEALCVGVRGFVGLLLNC